MTYTSKFGVDDKVMVIIGKRNNKYEATVRSVCFEVKKIKVGCAIGHVALDVIGEFWYLVTLDDVNDIEIKDVAEDRLSLRDKT